MIPPRRLRRFPPRGAQPAARQSRFRGYPEFEKDLFYDN